MNETGAYYYTEWSKPERKHQYSILMHIYGIFRKMVMIILYARQQKRHRCIEQSFGLCGRGWGWDGLGEWHWNMYSIICETDRQSRFDACYKVLGAGALGWPRGMGWGGKRKGVQNEEHRYTHGGFMSVYDKTFTIL